MQLAVDLQDRRWLSGNRLADHNSAVTLKKKKVSETTGSAVLRMEKQWQRELKQCKRGCGLSQRKISSLGYGASSQVRRRLAPTVQR